jgi:hypothetical protein
MIIGMKTVLKYDYVKSFAVFCASPAKNMSKLKSIDSARIQEKYLNTGKYCVLFVF